MIKLKNLTVGVFLFLTSCALFSTSMTPSQVNDTLLVSYKWVTVDHLGSTQLYVEFDTILCE